MPLFTDYTTDGFFDEMFESPNHPRAAYVKLFTGLRTLRPSTFAARSALVDRAYLSQGITFAHGGREQPFPFDLLPRPAEADGAHVFPRGPDAEMDAAGILLVGYQELEDVLLVADPVVLPEDRLRIEDADQYVPARLRAGGNIHDQVAVGLGQPGRVFGPLEVAAQELTDIALVFASVDPCTKNRHVVVRASIGKCGFLRTDPTDCAPQVFDQEQRSRRWQFVRPRENRVNGAVA